MEDLVKERRLNKVRAIKLFIKQLKTDYPSMYQNYINVFKGLLVYRYISLENNHMKISIDYPFESFIENKWFSQEKIKDIYQNISNKNPLLRDIFTSFVKQLDYIDINNQQLLNQYISLLQESDSSRDYYRLYLILNQVNNHQKLGMTIKMASEIISSLTNNQDIKKLLLLNWDDLSILKKMMATNKDEKRCFIYQSKQEIIIDQKIQCLLLNIDLNYIHFIKEEITDDFDMILIDFLHNYNQINLDEIMATQDKSTFYILVDTIHFKNHSFFAMVNNKKMIDKIIYLPFENIILIKIDSSKENQELELIDLFKEKKTLKLTRNKDSEVSDLLSNMHTKKVVRYEKLKENDYDISRYLYFNEVIETNVESLEKEYKELRSNNQKDIENLFKELNKF